VQRLEHFRQRAGQVVEIVFTERLLKKSGG
jgi:hypothetical protein